MLIARFAAAWLLLNAILAIGARSLPPEQAPRQGVSLPDLRATTLPEQCGSAFSQALTLCNGSPIDRPSTPCCQGLEAAGTECLRHVSSILSSSNQTLADQLKGASGTCGVSLSSSSSGTGTGTGGSSVLRPGAWLEHAWSVEAAGFPALCYNYLPTAGGNWTADGALGPWAGSGASVPPQGDVDETYGLLCQDPAAGSQALLQALGGGNSTAAQAAVAAILRGPCPGGTQMLEAAFRQFTTSPQLQDPTTAMPFAQAFVDAAEAIGAGACITVVSVDATGGLVDSHKLHSSLNRRTTSTGGSGWGAGSDSIGSGGGGGGGGPTSSLALPAGVIQTHISFGAKQMSCYAYTPGEDSAGTWTADPTAGLWSGTGSSMPPIAAIEQMSALLCRSPAEAGAALLAAVVAGGEAAQAAVKALLHAQCPSEGAIQGALASFTATPALNDPAQVIGYATALVEAADAVGAAMCYSLAVVDPATGALLASYQVHTSGKADVSAASITSDAANCTTAINGALDVCISTSGTDPSNATIASACCEAVRPLGGACLAQFQAVVDAEQDAETAQGLDALLVQCGVDNVAGSAQRCAAGFKSALSGCASVEPPDEACCASIERLGRPCLATLAGDPVLSQFVLASVNADVPGPSPLLSPMTACSQRVAGVCLSTTDDADTAASQAAPALQTQPLPDGLVLISWSMGMYGQCTAFNETSGEWRNTTTLPYRGSGFRRPSLQNVNTTANAFCADPAAAPALLLEALTGGGTAARVAVAALASFECPGDAGATAAIFDGFLDAPELRDPKTAQGLVSAFVQAADEIGMGACVTLVVVGTDGKVLFSEQLHTGGSTGIGGGSSSGSGSSNSSSTSSSGGSAAVVRWRGERHALLRSSGNRTLLPPG